MTSSRKQRALTSLRDKSVSSLEIAGRMTFDWTDETSPRSACRQLGAKSKAQWSIVLGGRIYAVNGAWFALKAQLDEDLVSNR